jgi:ATP-binding cassette, subfamily B, bacterial
MFGNHGILPTKLKRALGQLPYLPRALDLVWAAARRWTLAWAVLLVAQALLPVATVYLTRSLVDSLVAALGTGGAWQDIRPTLMLVTLMGGLLLLTELLGSARRWIRTAQAELAQDHINALIHQKSAAVDLGFYESPEYYDHLHRARVEASYRPVALLDSLGSLLQNAITLVAMGAVLLPYSFWLPVILLISTLPAFSVAVRYTLRQHQWRLCTTAEERRTWYYDWLLTSGETAAELRLFGLGAYFQSAYQTLRRRLRDERLQLARDQTLAELGAGAAALLITAAALGWMVWRALQGFASLGDLVLLYQAFNQGQRLMRSLLENIGQLYANILFLGHLFEFLALQPQVVDPPLSTPAPLALHEGIRFDHVTFRYPGSPRIALHDFTLTIPAGQIAAIVGLNGAGKSTVIKLLCRLYDPEAGRITLDGVDLRCLQIDELRHLITVLFQEPVHYNATVAQNIALGDLATAPSATKVQVAAQAAGADALIARLPQGYETLLGKWFIGGHELSVGEWQRLALARAFLRQAPVILLDEPTSAMDSWAEADWLERFRRLAAGRTVIIITHRFTTAMRADIIHVMAAGQIVESGRHQELLAHSGRYAQSWAAQMQAADRHASPAEVLASVGDGATRV